MKLGFLSAIIISIIIMFAGVIVFVLALGIIDTIFLKNGNKIEAEKCWIEGKHLKILTSGGTIAIPLDSVEKIEKLQENPFSPKASFPSSQASRDEKIRDISAQIEPNILVGGGGNSAPPNKEQIRKLEEAYRKNPGNISAKAQLIMARKLLVNDLIKQGKHAEAIEDLKPLLLLQPGDIDVSLALGALYLRTNNISMAETQLREAILMDYSNADAHYLLGEVYLRQEKLAYAIKEWQKSLQLKPDEALKAKLNRLMKEDDIRADYSETGSARFDLKYFGPPDSQLGKAILTVLESMHGQLSSRLDYLPRETIAVILYSDRDFYDATGAPYMVGGLYDGKVKIPIRGLRSIDSQVRNVLMHELTHAFLHSKTKGNCPVWLHEGIAQYMEGKSARAYNSQLALIVKNRGFTSLPLYPASLSMIEYLIKSYGFSDLLRILRFLGQGMSVDTALERSIHSNFDEFQQEWAEKALSVSP